MHKNKKQNLPKSTSKQPHSSSSLPKTIGNYIIISKIGKGSYANIYKVKKNIPNSPTLVLKQILITEEEDSIKEFQTEVQILSQLKSNYIIKYYDSFALSSSLNIITEYCEHGDLNDLLARQFNLNKRFDENLIWKIFIQTSLGLFHIHQQNILHRDIKAKNIFLNKNLDVKIGDLGIAKILQNTVHARTFIGTPYYISPELCKDLPYDKKSDVWSLGCVLYEMVMLKHPFDAETQLELYTKIINDDYEEVDDYYSKGLVNMIKLLLQKDFEKRPEIEEVIEMELFKKKMKEVGIKEHIHNNNSNIKNNNSNSNKKQINVNESNDNVNMSNVSNRNRKCNKSNIMKHIISSNSSNVIKSKTPTIQKVKKINSIEFNYQRFKQQLQQPHQYNANINNNNNNNNIEQKQIQSTKYIQHLPKARNNNNNIYQKQNPSTNSNSKSSNSNHLNISNSNILKHLLQKKITAFNTNFIQQAKKELQDLKSNQQNISNQKYRIKTSTNSKDKLQNNSQQLHSNNKKAKNENINPQLSANIIPHLTSSNSNYQNAININYSIPSPIKDKQFIRIAKKPKSYHHKKKISEQLSNELNQLNELKTSNFIKKPYKINTSNLSSNSKVSSSSEIYFSKKGKLSSNLINQIRTIQTIMTTRTNGSSNYKNNNNIKTKVSRSQKDVRNINVNKKIINNSEKKNASSSNKLFKETNVNKNKQSISNPNVTHDDSFTLKDQCTKQSNCNIYNDKGSVITTTYNNSQSSDNEKENVYVIKERDNNKTDEEVIKETNELLVLYRKYNEKLSALHYNMNTISKEICYKVFDMYHQINEDNNPEKVTEQIEQYVKANISDEVLQKDFMNYFYNYVLYEIKFKNVNNELHNRNMSDNLD